MQIESINGVSEVQFTNNNADYENVNAQPNYQQQTRKGSSRDIWMTLGIIASMAVASAALIENKNSKSEYKTALKKAEEARKVIAAELEKVRQEADNKIKELSEKLKQETDNKINEAVKKLNKNINIKYNNLLYKTNCNMDSEIENITAILKQETDRIINDAIKKTDNKTDIKINEVIDKVKQDIRTKLQELEENTGRIDTIISEFEKIINQDLSKINELSNMTDEKNRIILIQLKTPEFIKKTYNKVSEFFKSLKVKFKMESAKVEEAVNKSEGEEKIIQNTPEVKDVKQKKENKTPETDIPADNNTPKPKKKFGLFSSTSKYFKSLKEKLSKPRVLELEGGTVDWQLTDTATFYEKRLQQRENELKAEYDKTPELVQKLNSRLSKIFKSIKNVFKNDNAVSENKDIEYKQIIQENDNTVRFILKNKKSGNNK